MTEARETTVLRQKFGLQKSNSLRLSTRTLNAYQEAFSAIDKKGTGKIDRQGLEMVLAKLGQKPTDEELKIMLNIDPTQDGHLQFHTFAKLMSQRMPVEQQVDELQQVFDIFPKDENGNVAISDIKKTLSDVYGESFDDLEELLGVSITRVDFVTFRKLMLGESL